MMDDINRVKAMALLESLNDSMDRAIRNALSRQSWPAHSSSQQIALRPFIQYLPVINGVRYGTLTMH
ncbi:hypothetical protein GJE22_05840 [Enorma sp. HF-1365]|uniref:Uncharacterized protein n=1 Tax=Enorma shizhengliae TaxID=2606615 RepID=A0A7K0G8W1_9ACTN|nr:hypothetical protein [Enorma shizhengliae]